MCWRPLFGEGRVARFTSAVERQMLDLVRGNPTRLLVLVTATGASYLLMALEAYVIVRASGASFTPNGALAAETLSRVASFASAFIPANLGALEASSLAAVAAVGRGGGWRGARARSPPARDVLGRRGTGDLSAPASARPSIAPPSTQRTSGPAATLLYFPNDPSVSVPPSAKLAGLPIAERVVRSAVRAGYSRIVVWAPETDPADAVDPAAAQARARDRQQSRRGHGHARMGVRDGIARSRRRRDDRRRRYRGLAGAPRQGA